MDATDTTTDATPVPRAARVAATAAATRGTSGRVRPERVEVVKSSDRRREHAPELRARLVAEMMAGGVVSAVSRREGICTSVLHRWLRRARRETGLPVAAAATRLLPVQIASPADAVRPVPHSAPTLDLVLGNGRVSRIPPGADPAVVAGLAAALER